MRPRRGVTLPRERATTSSLAVAQRRPLLHAPRPPSSWPGRNERRPGHWRASARLSGPSRSRPAQQPTRYRTRATSSCQGRRERRTRMFALPTSTAAAALLLGPRPGTTAGKHILRHVCTWGCSLVGAGGLDVGGSGGAKDRLAASVNCLSRRAGRSLVQQGAGVSGGDVSGGRQHSAGACQRKPWRRALRQKAIGTGARRVVRREGLPVLRCAARLSDAEGRR